jgi:hypothetical protein
MRRVKVNFLGRARICNPDTDLKTCADNATGLVYSCILARAGFL